MTNIQVSESKNDGQIYSFSRTSHFAPPDCFQTPFSLIFYFTLLFFPWQIDILPSPLYMNFKKYINNFTITHYITVFPGNQHRHSALWKTLSFLILWPSESCKVCSSPNEFNFVSKTLALNCKQNPLILKENDEVYDPNPQTSNNFHRLEYRER